MSELEPIVHRIRMAALLLATAQVLVLLGVWGGACGPSYGAAVAPAALTAHAVIDCVEACEDAPNLAAAIAEKIECTPKVIEAARAWCASGVVEGPFCAALPGKE